MSTCDFKVTLSPTQQPLTIKSETGQCCTIAAMNDVDLTESSANGTVLVWDADYNIFVRIPLNISALAGVQTSSAGPSGGDGTTITVLVWDAGDNAYKQTQIGLQDLVNMSGGSPTDGSVMVYDSSSNTYVSGCLDNICGIDSSDTTDGSILIYNSSSNTYVRTSPTFNFLTDVNITSQANGDIIQFDAASNTYINVPLTLNLIGNISANATAIGSSSNGAALLYDSSSNNFIIVNIFGWDSDANKYTFEGDTIIINTNRSQSVDTPTSLANGQMHYSYSSNKLYIGQTDTPDSPVTVEYIGGKLLVDKVANLESVIATLSGSGATLANTVITGLLTLSTYPQNAALRTKAGGVIEAVTGTYGEVFQVAANGTPYFDDLNGGTY